MTTVRIPLTRNLLWAVAVIISLAMAAMGQTAAQRPDRGTMPGASYSMSDLEKISLTNGNLSLAIPLASLPPIAGGRLKLGISAVYNSKLWNITRTEHQMPPLSQPPDGYQWPGGSGCQQWVVSNPQLSDIGGWTITAGYRIVFRAKEEDYAYERPNPPPTASCEEDVQEQQRLQYTWYRAILITPDGAEHELRPTDAYQPFGVNGGNRSYLYNYYKETPSTINQSMRYYSFDGSFMYVVINPPGSSTWWTVYMNDGTTVSQTNNGIQRITDTNGNSIKIIGTTLQDELTGREIQYSYDAGANNGKGQGQVRYQTVGGSWQTININFDTKTDCAKLVRIKRLHHQIGDGSNRKRTKSRVASEVIYVFHQVSSWHTKGVANAPRDTVTDTRICKTRSCIGLNTDMTTSVGRTGKDQYGREWSRKPEVKMKLHPQQIEAVVALTGPERYSHFIKQAADSKEVWGLYEDGWAMAATDNGEPVLPLWPAEEYAAMSAKNDWAGYEPSLIALEDLIGELLPMLDRDGILPGIFFTPAEKGVTPKVSQLLADLHQELSRYE